MTTPGFAATAALEAPERSYRSQNIDHVIRPVSVVVPQQGVSGLYVGTVCAQGEQRGIYVTVADDGSVSFNVLALLSEAVRTP